MLLALLAGNSLAQSLVGRVVGVTDGDTVTLLVNGRIQLLRARGSSTASVAMGTHA